MEQNPDTIANRIIKKIEEDHVAPLAKWRFVIKNPFNALVRIFNERCNIFIHPANPFL